MTRAAATAIILLLGAALLHAGDGGQTEAIIKSILEGDPAESPARPPETKKAPEVKKEAAPVKRGQPARKGPNEESPGAATPDETLLKTGIQLYNAELYDAAMAKFNELRTKYPQSPFKDAAAVWMGRIYSGSNRPADAIRELSSVGEDSGEYPTALYGIGEAHYKAGNIPDAVEYFYRVSSLFPDNERADDALLFLGNIYLNQKKGNQALEMAVKIIKYYPDRETVDDAYYLIGKVYEKDPVLKDFEIARKVYRVFLRKANEEKQPGFQDSPLTPRVERDLRYIETTYFKMEN